MDRAADAGTHPAGRGSRKFRSIAIGMFLAALAYFAWRGVARGIVESHDLAVGYAAARAWLAGLDPYNVANLKEQLFAGGGGGLAISEMLDTFRNVYFPTTLPSFVPLAILPWPAAKTLALVINLAMSAFIVLGLVHLLGWRRTEPRALFLAAFVLALAPLHRTVSSGQSPVVAVGALIAAMLLTRSGRPVVAGLLYGLATVLKVQLGLPFLAYLVWRRRWTSLVPAVILLAALSAVSIARMELAETSWLSSWLANLVSLSGPGGLNDPSLLNLDRYTLINLEYPLSTLLPGGLAATLVTYALVGVASLVLILIVRDGEPRHELLAVATIAVLSLLVAYHRYYDAVLLVLPIAWAISSLGTARQIQGAGVLLLSADFLIPAQTALHELQQGGALPAWLTDVWWWETVVLAQHAWSLALMVPILLYAAVRDREPGSRWSTAPSVDPAR